MSAKQQDNELWLNLPTAPVPNLEEMKIAAEFKNAWSEFAYAPRTSEQLAEFFYRKGRIAGKDAATREITGRRLTT